MKGAPENFHFHDLQFGHGDFHAEVVTGLDRESKCLPPKLFYDARGSQLFDAITRLPEYYPTRTEIGLLQRHGEEMAEMLGHDGLLFELGSGSDAKIRVLLGALQPQAYAPIDISRGQLRLAAGAIAQDHPELEVHAICADYSKPLALPGCFDTQRQTAYRRRPQEGSGAAACRLQRQPWGHGGIQPESADADQSRAGCGL